MAKVIGAPPQALGDNWGEIEIFKRLSNDPGTKDWYVLHSLDISTHVKNATGEADFLVLIPQKGLIVLEIKGTNKVVRDDDAWYYGEAGHIDSKGPFKQVKEAMFSLRNYLIQREGSFDQVTFANVVIFPHISEFNQIVETDEWHPWQVIDVGTLGKAPISKLLSDIVDKTSEELPFKAYVPSVNDCKKMTNIFRQRFEIRQSIPTQSQQVEEEISSYTEEQYRALDLMENNHRVLFEGPAGTGKTYLAIESARRSSILGKSVLFVCFNRLLAQWLQQAMEALVNVKVTTIHSFMHASVGGTSVNVNSSDYFTDTLPTLALQEVLSKETGEDDQYDLLILDEAQDILAGPYLDFLDFHLKGGLCAGEWHIFGDFTNQSIFIPSDRDDTAVKIFQERCLYDMPMVSMYENCRNTPETIQFAQKITNKSNLYKRFLRPAGRYPHPQIRVYDDQNDQKQKLKKSINVLLGNGYRNDDITVLSILPRDNSVFSSIHLDFPGIRHASVREFKGLESQAILLTDINTTKNDDLDDLLYVGTTRAQAHLELFIERPFLVTYLELLKQGDRYG